MENQRVIEIHCVNATGVLNRITALFFARGISIDSMISCETEKENQYVIFVELTYDWKTVAFICRLLNKLIDVIEVRDITEEIHTERQLMLIKISYSDKELCLKGFDELEYEIIGEKDGKLYIEFADTLENTQEVIKNIEGIESVEYLRSGRMFLK